MAVMTARALSRVSSYSAVGFESATIPAPAWMYAVPPSMTTVRIVMQPQHILISPGPGRPEAAGVSVETIRRFGSAVPVLGVCLGHQAMGAAFGGQVIRANQLMHGKASIVEHDGRGVFAGLTEPFSAGRYHSLMVADQSWPDTLEVAARASDTGTVMGLRHRQWPMHGVQFHPESVLTTEGRRILRNFLELGGRR